MIYLRHFSRVLIRSGLFTRRSLSALGQFSECCVLAFEIHESNRASQAKHFMRITSSISGMS